jgi:hypothetical protein
MAGSKQLCSLTLRKIPQFPELHRPVAENAGIGRPTFSILAAEILKNQPEIIPKVQHVKFYTQFLGDLLGIVLCVGGPVTSFHKYACAFESCL